MQYISRITEDQVCNSYQELKRKASDRVSIIEKHGNRCKPIIILNTARRTYSKGPRRNKMFNGVTARRVFPITRWYFHYTDIDADREINRCWYIDTVNSCQSVSGELLSVLHYSVYRSSHPVFYTNKNTHDCMNE